MTLQKSTFETKKMSLLLHKFFRTLFLLLILTSTLCSLSSAQQRFNSDRKYELDLRSQNVRKYLSDMGFRGGVYERGTHGYKKFKRTEVKMKQVD